MIDERLSQLFGEIAEQFPPSRLTIEAIEARRRAEEAEDARRLRNRRRAVTVLVAAAGIVGVIGVVSMLGDDHNVDTNPAVTAPSTASPRTVATTTPAESTTTSATTTTTPGIVPPSPTDVLIETVDRDGPAVQLARVDGVTGAVKDVVWGRSATINTFDDSVESPLLDADLSPDGTAYIVERTASAEEYGARPGGTQLIATDSTPSRTVAANVTSVRVSADGSQVAVSVLSPDGNGDGTGTIAIRVITLSTGETRTLVSNSIPLLDSGDYGSEFDNMTVVSWLPDGGGVVYKQECCDSGALIVAPLDGEGDPADWPRVDSFRSTFLLGFTPDGNPIVQRQPDDVAEWQFEIVTLDLGSLEVSAPLTTGEHELDYRPRYDLIGSSDVPGTASDRGRDAFSVLVGDTTSAGVVARAFG